MSFSSHAQQTKWRHEVGQRLLQVRTQLGWTQQEMADRLGWSPSTISLIERGNCRNAKTLEGHVALLTRLLRLPMHWLSYGIGEPTATPAMPTLPAITLNALPVGVDEMSQLDRIEKKLDLILNHIGLKL